MNFQDGNRYITSSEHLITAKTAAYKIKAWRKQSLRLHLKLDSYILKSALKICKCMVSCTEQAIPQNITPREREI